MGYEVFVRLDMHEPEYECLRDLFLRLGNPLEAVAGGGHSSYRGLSAGERGAEAFWKLLIDWLGGGGWGVLRRLRFSSRSS